METASPTSYTTHSKRADCRHCSLPIPLDRVGLDHDGVSGLPASDFCCAGCDSVYHVLHELGLENFYQELEKTNQTHFPPAAQGSSSYEHFDDEQFLAENLRQRADGLSEVQLYLEGIHCAACVWLLEQLPNIVSGVRETRVNLSTSKVRIVFQLPEVRLSEIASAIERLGYRPHHVAITNEEEARNREKRSLLIRLGVAGACAGNTMMLAVSLYEGSWTGIEPQYGALLSWFSMALAMPAVFYSAQPFYRAAIGGLRVGRVHIDLSISIGILLGFFASLVNTIRGELHVYYESITMLIFLLLLGRWFQRSSIERLVEQSGVLASLMPTRALVLDATGEQKTVFVKSLAIGDIVIVGPTELFPCDGEIVDGSSHVDQAIVTGESLPIEIARGSLVMGGTRNISHAVHVRVNKLFEESRLSHIANLVEEGAETRAPITQTTDRLSAYFVTIVLSLATGVFVWTAATSDVFSALDITLALLIVTCPCALGLSAPIALAVATKRAALSGILFRSQDAIERAAKIDTVVFDKTGTLTQGIAEAKLVYSSDQLAANEIAAIAMSLEQGVHHPVADSLRRLSSESSVSSPIEFSERSIVHGAGVFAHGSDGLAWYLGAPRWVEQYAQFSPEQRALVEQTVSRGASCVCLSKGEVVVAIFELADVLRPEAVAVVDGLRKDGFQALIVSGDVRQVVESVGQELNLDGRFLHAEQSPEEKFAFLERAQDEGRLAAMVGDGVNDAAALTRAGLGVGISGGAEICLRVADAYLSRPDLRLLERLFSGAKRTIRTIRLNIVFSLFYNVIGATAAILGYVTPVFAAILMPLSSLTVVLSSTLAPTFRTDERSS